MIADIFFSYVNLVPVTLVQSLIYAFVALGIMVPFRLLGFPDLTSEGSFPLGGAVCGALLAAGLDPFTGIAVASFAGFLAGCATAFIHLRFRINTLLAGILVMTMLYSVNLRVLGKPNIALFNFGSLFRLGEPLFGDPTIHKIVVLAVVVALVCGALLWFLHTERGVALRAVGSNATMARAQGISVWTYTIVGVGIANGFNALAGSLVVQSNGFASVALGTGVLINGLAALIIGETIVGRRTVLRQIVAPVVGAVIFYQLVSLCLSLGLAPSDLQFLTGAFVLVTLALPTLRGRATAPMAQEKFRE